MKVRDGGLFIILFIAAIAGIGFGAAKLTQKDDGPIEEAAEEIIESQTGIDVDLTPGSNESN